MTKPVDEPKLSPGTAFRLQPDGSWSPEKLPHDVLSKAVFSGYLTIEGYRCSVFEASDESMWAQKSVNTPAVASSKELPDPDMSIKCPECGGKATDVRAYSACCGNGHFFSVKPKKASADTIQWVAPSLDDELGEIERTSYEFSIDLNTLKAAYETGTAYDLNESDWSRLDNTDSNKPLSLERARRIAKKYERDLDTIISGFESGESMKMPVVLELDDGSITLLAGNTRLMAARVLGLTPTVWWVSPSTFSASVSSMETIASRVAAAWISRTADRADDLVSQVNEILEGGSDGPFGHDDVAYDDDIAKWCEKVVEKMPEMQDIFDEAFHGLMDFKGKMPASDNPRVRQIADEKVSEMLNQAAARLEIISHGLMEEIQTLCTGLAAGAPAESEKTEKRASEPANISEELIAIANAIDASTSPDHNLVAHDLSRILASLQSE